jgi:hypothetical protein
MKYWASLRTTVDVEDIRTGADNLLRLASTADVMGTGGSAPTHQLMLDNVRNDEDTNTLMPPLVEAMKMLRCPRVALLCSVSQCRAVLGSLWLCVIDLVSGFVPYKNATSRWRSPFRFFFDVF